MAAPHILDIKYPGKEYQFFGFYWSKWAAVERAERLRAKHPGMFYMVRHNGKMIAQK